MTVWLKQSTSVSVVIGPIWSTSDGSLKADLAYNASGINCDLYKNGTKADVTLANSAGDGYFRAGSGEAQYILTLSTGHTDTLGVLRLTLSATGYYMKPVDFMVVPANVYDSLIAASDYLQADAVQIEGSDATNQIRDSLVDDATRIDASAVNTLAGHDPGEVIMGATDLGTGTGLTTLASAAELAKVPKSDSTVSFNATALAAIADKLLGRAVAGSADGGRTVAQALASLRNKVVISGGVMTVYAADDTTPLWTAALTTNAAAEPITTIDPT